MSNDIKTNTVNTPSVATPAANLSTQTYQKGTVLHSINADKYTGEVKEGYIFESTDGISKYRVKLQSMLELSEAEETSDEVSLLIRNGYEGSGKMSAGSGVAVKMTKTDTSYECIFYEGEVGKQFDPKKIQSKSYMSIDRKHLEALFIYLRCNESVAQAKAEAQKVQRTTLDLK